MNAGVSTLPWRVWSSPRRARLPGSRAVTWKNTDNSLAVSQEEHGIAVTGEAVSPLHRLSIRVEDPLPPGERRREEQQSGLRKVKIRDQRIHAAKDVARKDVEVALSLRGFQLALPGHMLQHPSHGGPHGNHPPSAALGLCHATGRLRGQGESFGMQPMMARVRRPYRQESARSHVERERGPPDSPLFQAPEELRGKMEACRGGRHRSAGARVDRLVLLRVPFPARIPAYPPDVRGKRDLAPKIQHLFDIRPRGELQNHPLVLSPRHLSRRLPSEMDFHSIP